MKDDHPFDTNDYLDLPDGVKIEVPLTLQDRIDGQCGDVHRCTIANAITRQNVGIIELGRRGVSRRYVGMYLDKRIFPWAEAGRVYRGRLTDRSAEVTLELDELGKTPATRRAIRNVTRKLAAAAADGANTVFETIVIVSPYPSEKKGYRAGVEAHGTTGRGGSRSRRIPRREWKTDTLPVPAAKRPLKKKGEAA